MSEIEQLKKELEILQQKYDKFFAGAKGASELMHRKYRARVENIEKLEADLKEVNEEWNLAVQKVFHYRRLARSRHGHIKALAKLVNEAYYVEEFCANGHKKKFNETIVNQQMQTILNTKGYL